VRSSRNAGIRKGVAMKGSDWGTQTVTRARDMLRGTVRGFAPKVGIVLGSGLAEVVSVVDRHAVVPFEVVPGMAVSTTDGHRGNFILGCVGSEMVLCMQGRVHYYEGYDLREVTLPIRIMQALGVEFLLLTAAVGAVPARQGLKPGDFAVIADHINLMGANPLRGPHVPEWGERFPDMTEVYDRQLRTVARKAALKKGIRLREVVYAAFPGPSYETPAEVRMAARLGAQVVGMSVVPEAIVARQAGMRTLGMVYVSNVAATAGGRSLSHVDVLAIGRKVPVRMAPLIREIVGTLPF
jgi:purine-nucleoside phosphorylase